LPKSAVHSHTRAVQGVPLCFSFWVPERRHGVPFKDADAKHEVLVASLISNILGERVSFFWHVHFMS
jgi:hypothetical protein